MSIIVFIIILGILVLVHEFGHFIAAKKSGVKVEEFGFGFPPRVFGKKIGETIYSLNLFPIGGFVKLFGEEYHEVGKSGRMQELSAENKKRTFVYKKPWQKALIIVAGVCGNFLLGWIVISYLFTQGVPVPINKVIVQGVQKNAPAQLAGIVKKDTVQSLQYGQKTYKIESAEDLTCLVGRFAGKKISLGVQRDDKNLTVDVIPRIKPPKGQGPLGVFLTVPFVIKKYTWYQAPFFGLFEAFDITKKVVLQFGKILSQLIILQKPCGDFSGPVGIANYTGEALKVGINAVLELLALLSLNLAVINILPFPALDGGRLVFIVYEWITKKRVNQDFERKLNLVGFALLLTLAVLITIHDIIKIYR